MQISRWHLLVLCLITMFLLGVVTIHIRMSNVSHVPTQPIACGGLVLPGCL